MAVLQDLTHRRNARRAAIVHGALAVLALAVAVKCVKVQVGEHRRWAAVAREQQQTTTALPPVRGAILDAAGAPLAETRVMVRVAVAPREVHAWRRVEQALRAAGIADSLWLRVRDTTARWVTLPGRFNPTAVAPLRTTRGVYLTDVMDRTYVPGEGIQRLLGRVTLEGRGTDGLERSLDSLLRGTPGEADILRSGLGERLANARRAPVPGAAVQLTIHRQLQDIAEDALQGAIDSTGAAGGDVVVLDVATGAIRALVSVRRHAPATGLPALVEPYEPGSTLKPFYAAALLGMHRARPGDVVATHDGLWVLDGREIRDDHKASEMTLREVIAQSSNIGAVQFVQRLKDDEQYALLLGLGLGHRTGIPYPVEARGRVPEPRRWSSQTKASLAMGYELLATPLQLAAAYATLANGGVRVRPYLVERALDAAGHDTVQQHRAATAGDRVFAAAAADTVLGMLRDVVEAGTAQRARLATFAVGGKTGTAKRIVGRHYGTSYTASFVGLFPGGRPQLVLLAKLDDPQGAYYGGVVAAPVVRAILEGALAAEEAPLDRYAALQWRGAVLGATAGAPIDSGALTAHPRGGGPAPLPAPILFSLGAQPAEPAAPLRPVPIVTGLGPRTAVVTLQRAGFLAALGGIGPRVVAQSIAPGTTAARGVRVLLTLGTASLAPPDSGSPFAMPPDSAAGGVAAPPVANQRD